VVGAVAGSTYYRKPNCVVIIAAISLHLPMVIMNADLGWYYRMGVSSMLDWLTVVAYLVAACLAYFAHRNYQDAANRHISFDSHVAENHRRVARLWIVGATALLLLGFSRQTPYLARLLDALRILAIQQAWYEERHRYQALFIGVIVALGLLGITLTLYWLRPVIRPVMVAVLALNFIVAFFIIRATSFHPIDQFWGVGNLHWNRIFELGGIGAVALTAHLARRSVRSPPLS
jgi:hypothetical protein